MPQNFPGNPAVVSPTPKVPVPATIAASGVYDTGLIPSGQGAVAAACTLDQTGTLTIQRYADVAGLVPVGPLISQALSASTPAWAGAADGLPSRTWRVQITNTSGSTGNLSGVAFLTGVNL